MPDTTLTTQTTASTEIAHPLPGQGYSEWQIAAGIAGGVGGLLAAIAAILVIVNTVRGWIRDKDGDEEKQSAELRAEIDCLAAMCREFKTKAELAEDAQQLRTDIEHEKNNRKTAEKAAADKFREHDAAIVSLREGQARQLAMIEGFSGAIGRIENAIDRLNERFDARFDALQRLVVGKP
jgi:hypothetical protein